MSDKLTERIDDYLKNYLGADLARQILKDCKKALEAKPSIDALIAEIDEILIDAPDMGVAYSLRRLANKYRVGRRTK